MASIALAPGFEPLPSANPSGPPTDTSRWVCVYPPFLAASKTLAEGRRVPAAVAVPAPGPHAIEIFETCRLLKFPAEVDMRKCHPRDNFMRGRVRVKLFQDGEGKVPVREDVTSRKELFMLIAKHIPKFRELHAAKQNAIAVSSVQGKAQAKAEAKEKAKGKKGKR
eukprot:CAMPEP_0184718756 /NCGR_PEP_ID=MMETSP0314-20130426/7862_1 /TAXON_ID=38298 /ORGANISM="Rhodella maculata, Strain CCMP 736" /LENGTH=165 /DNA_ID=CAMNT_0027182547 /DNA_START=327 /DNA_END=824 /DNA_ORIENTATION=+